MAVDCMKWVTFSEEILSEGGRELEKPLRRVAVAAVLKNPYAGEYSEDISELIDAGEWLATELMVRAKAALGGPVEAYGKGGIVGEKGELEHVAALLHPKFGAPVRAAADGVSILPSVKKAPTSTSRSTTRRRCSSAATSTPWRSASRTPRRPTRSWSPSR